MKLAAKVFLTLVGGCAFFSALARVASIEAAPMTLSTGDIVVANSGSVVVVDAVTGNITTVACCFSAAIGVAVDADRRIIVSDRFTASIIRIDPETETQTTVTTSDLLVQPHGVAVAANGDILVADIQDCCGPGTGRIVRVDPITGTQTLVSDGGSFVDPTGVEEEIGGHILTADFNARKLFRVDPLTGNQVMVASFLPDGEPYDVTVAEDGSIFVIDHNDRVLYRIDPATGDKTIISSAGFFDQPVGVAVENSTTLLITDFTANNLIRVDVATGAQSILASFPGISNPWGIAVVAGAATPTPSPTGTPQIGPPTNKDQCKSGDWQVFNTPRTFRNQGDCVAFVNTGR